MVTILSGVAEIISLEDKIFALGAGTTASLPGEDSETEIKTSSPEEDLLVFASSSLSNVLLFPEIVSGLSRNIISMLFSGFGSEGLSEISCGPTDPTSGVEVTHKMVFCGPET